jgi:predicted DNA-binding mobile mystery protein A
MVIKPVMDSRFRSLRAKQLDRTLIPFQALKDVKRPLKGWIRAIRQAAGLSAGELARELGVSRQLPLQLEKAEADDKITLASLRKMAHALDCELVYALVPRSGLVAELQENRARRQAQTTVLEAQHSMTLEDQAVDHIEHSVEAETQRILSKKSGR